LRARNEHVDPQRADAAECQLLPGAVIESGAVFVFRCSIWQRDAVAWGRAVVGNGRGEVVMSLESMLVVAGVLVVSGCAGDDDAAGSDAGERNRADAATVAIDAAGNAPDSSPGRDASPTLDASVVECAAEGAGTVTSTTAGVEVDPVMSTWFMELDPPRSLIAIDERLSSCDPEAVRDQLGHFVTIFFCDALSEGDYQVVADLPDACPGERIVGVVVQDEEFEEDVRTMSGTVTIASWAGCVVGSFDTTTTEGEELSGTFEAYRCE
jgi:hypothetical protein